MASSKTQFPLALYDGECGICEFFKEFFRRNSPGHSIEFVPYQTANYAQLPPGVEGERARDALCFVDARGGIFYGAMAVSRLLIQLPGIWRAVGRLLSLPPVRPVSEFFYRILARHRREISRWLGLKQCALEAKQSPM